MLLRRDVGSIVRWSGVDQTSDRGPKTYDAAGGTDPGDVRDGCLVMTGGLAVIGDCEIPLKSGTGLVSSNGSTSGLVGRISADPNSLRGGTSYTFMHRLYNTVIKRTSQSTM